MLATILTMGTAWAQHVHCRTVRLVIDYEPNGVCIHLLKTHYLFAQLALNRYIIEHFSFYTLNCTLHSQLLHY